jgi:hypothetical protein
MATARAVKMTTTRATKRVRAIVARAMRLMVETSLSEEGDDGHVVSRLDMYRTKVLTYRTMVLLARLTKGQTLDV